MAASAPNTNANELLEVKSGDAPPVVVALAAAVWLVAWKPAPLVVVIVAVVFAVVFATVCVFLEVWVWWGIVVLRCIVVLVPMLAVEFPVIVDVIVEFPLVFDQPNTSHYHNYASYLFVELAEALTEAAMAP